MCEAFEAIWELHSEDKIPLRTAAFVKALQVGRLAGWAAAGLPGWVGCLAGGCLAGWVGRCHELPGWVGRCQGLPGVPLPPPPPLHAAAGLLQPAARAAGL